MIHIPLKLSVLPYSASFVKMTMKPLQYTVITETQCSF